MAQVEIYGRGRRQTLAGSRQPDAVNNGLRISTQHGRIHIALEGNSVADSATLRRGDIGTPIKTQRVTAGDRPCFSSQRPPPLVNRITGTSRPS